MYVFISKCSQLLSTCSTALQNTRAILTWVVFFREGSITSDMGSRASMRDDDIARAEFVVDSARQAVGELMRKLEQVCTASRNPFKYVGKMGRLRPFTDSSGVNMHFQSSCRMWRLFKPSVAQASHIQHDCGSAQVP